MFRYVIACLFVSTFAVASVSELHIPVKPTPGPHAPTPAPTTDPTTPPLPRRDILNDRDDGASLLALMNDVQDSLNWNCTGDACYGMWRNQMNAMDELNRFVDLRTPPATCSFDDTLGLKAKAVHQQICGTRITGEPSTIAQLVGKYNVTMDKLYRIYWNSTLTNNDLAPCQLVMQ